jgi:hypothetical protein
MHVCGGCILRNVVVDPFGDDVELQLMRELHAGSKVKVDGSKEAIILLMEV